MYTMKSKLTLLVALCIVTENLIGQIPGNQRGLYINQFVDLFHNTGPIPPNNSINPFSSILGNTGSEDALLTYCMENHITYITLYDMANIFDGTSHCRCYYG